jgi:glutaminyl-peptide cyclotransferase
MNLKISIILAFISGVVVLGQGRATSTKTNFSGASALAYSARAVSFGQRPAGSESISNLRNWIISKVKPTGATVSLDSFNAFTPTGSVPMVNVIAHFSGTSGKAIVITGHYDTKRMPLVNFVGANDGGSSTGFLVELARAVSQMKHKDDLYLVWLDGEEAVVRWSASDSCYGSRHLAEKWGADGTLSRIKALINVDMIGDKSLDLVQDSNSSGALRNQVWQIADQLGYGKYFLRTEGAIDDDHVPFISAGVNALDLIDFDYGPGNSYWHTDKDTTDKLSARSLQIVGDVVLKAIEAIERQ